MWLCNFCTYASFSTDFNSNCTWSYYPLAYIYMAIFNFDYIIVSDSFISKLLSFSLFMTILLVVIGPSHLYTSDHTNLQVSSFNNSKWQICNFIGIDDVQVNSIFVAQWTKWLASIIAHRKIRLGHISRPLHYSEQI